MNELEKAKARYLETPIPAELHHRVRIAIRQGRQNRSRKSWRRSFAAAAACLAMLMGVLNLSPGIAMAAADVPLLGGLFQILTIRSYAALEDGVDYQLNVPAVEADSETAARVNAEIEERVDALLAKGTVGLAGLPDSFLCDWRHAGRVGRAPNGCDREL